MSDPQSQAEPVSSVELARTGLIAAAVIALALVLFYGADIATGASLFFTHDIAFSDIWHLNYPLKHFYQQELAQGHLPLWCPEIGTGFPLHAEGQVGALSPLNLLLYSLLPLPLAFNGSILLHAWLAGLFASMFARRVGAGRGGSVLAGMIFALSGFFVAHLKHLNMTEAAAWIPLLLLLVDLYAAERRRRTIVVFAVAVAAMFLAGHPQIAYNNLLVSGAYALFLQVRIWRRPSPKGRARDTVGFAGGLLVAVLAGLMLAAPQILPTLELHGVGPRQGGLSMDEATKYPYRPAHLALFVAPYAFGDPGDLQSVPDVDGRSGEPRERLTGFTAGSGRPTFFWEVTGYVGLLPLALALFGAAAGFSSVRVKALLGGLVLSVLVALGKLGGLFYVLWFLPGFRLFRFHGRFILYADLVLAVLAGIGLTLLLRHAAIRKRKFAAAGIATLALVLSFWDVHHYLGDHNPKIDAGHWDSPPASVLRILEEEAGSGKPFRMVDTDSAGDVFRNAYHRARGWKGDLAPYDTAKSMLSPNLNVLFGVTNLRTYFQIRPRWMQQLASIVNLPEDERTGRSAGLNPRVLGLYNVKYVLDATGDLAGKAATIDEYAGDVRLHRAMALPRAYLVPRARTVVDNRPAEGEADEPLRELLGAGFDPLREVLIVRQPGEAEIGGEPAGSLIETPVEFVEYGSRRVHLRVEAPADSWLVLSDTYYPGWQAEVDGDAVPIYRANVAGRAIRVPAGRHEVVFEFVARSFHRGWMVAALGIVLLVGFIVAFRMRLKTSVRGHCVPDNLSACGRR